MMKKISSILIGVIVAIVLFGAGYFVRGTLDKPLAEKPSEEKMHTISGVYECEDGAWNGHRETMIIFDDGTYKAPTGHTGTWEQIDDKTIQFYTGSVQITGYIADTGVDYAGTFFEKK